MTQGGHQALLQEACILHAQARHEDALTAINTVIAQSPSVLAYQTKARILQDLCRPDDAAEALEEALELDIHDHVSLSILADICAQQGEQQQAIGLLVLAIAAKPDEIPYMEKFLHMAGHLTFSQYNEQMANTLVTCLKTPDVECTMAQILWLSLFEQAPHTGKIYRLHPGSSPAAFDPRGLGEHADLSPLNTPLFIEGLQRLAVYRPPFEQFLTCLRRHLLLHVGAQNTPPLPLRLAAALAHYCFFVEYIFDVSPDEQIAVDALARHLSANPDDVAAACLYGCYAPMSSLANADMISGALKEKAGAVDDGAVFASLALVQIDDPAAQEEDKKNIPALTEIDGGVSLRVRAQYEEFPYPRWKKLTAMKIEPEVSHILSKSSLDILVAGCGTGREALNAATTLTDAQVLALDLSLTSLAYARSRAKQLGLRNIEFKQADITKLSSVLPQHTFDYITSSGVLHHLEDPEKGLDILSQLLKPGGVMRIALYSERGRKSIVAARHAIAKGGYPSTPQGMRDFRRDMPDLLHPAEVADLTNFGDFYHMSMFRDFLFHEQEHRFDIPRIKRALARSGLTFVKFGVKNATEAMYQKAHPDGKHTLERWHVLEQKNPSLFREMYFIWCLKAT